MFSLIELDSVDSTNSWARRELAHLNDGQTFIIAREQTSGRGRSAHAWLSPPDQNIYLTFVESKRQSLSYLHYTQAAALCLASLLQNLGITAQIKWPNDLLVKGKKISGILVEEASKGHVSHVILGIGLNVNMDKELLQQMDRPVTSIQECLGTSVCLPSVKQSLITMLLHFLQLGDNSPSSLHTSWVKACSWMIGTERLVSEYDKSLHGTIRSINDDGSMQLEFNDGTSKKLVAPD